MAGGGGSHPETEGWSCPESPGDKQKDPDLSGDQGSVILQVHNLGRHL